MPSEDWQGLLGSVHDGELITLWPGCLSHSPVEAPEQGDPTI